MRTLYGLLVTAALLFSSGCSDWIDLAKEDDFISDAAEKCNGLQAGEKSPGHKHCCMNQVFMQQQPHALAANSVCKLGGELSSALGLSKKDSMVLNASVVRYKAYHKDQPHCRNCKKECDKTFVSEEFRLFGSLYVHKNFNAKAQADIKSKFVKIFDGATLTFSFGKTTHLSSSGPLVSLCVVSEHKDCSIKTPDFTGDPDMVSITAPGNMDRVRTRISGQLLQGITLTPKTMGNPLVYTPVGTGETTGPVLTMTVHNPTDVPLVTQIEDAYVPATADQSYLIRGTGPIAVGPGATVDLTLSGTCALVNKPPIRSGVPAPSVTEWLYRSELPPVAVCTDCPGVSVVTVAPGTPTVVCLPPVSTRAAAVAPPLGIRIDPVANQPLFASFTWTAYDNIETAIDQLYAADRIHTPFSDNRTKEREGLGQQTLWRFTTGVAGGVYHVEDFERNLIRQYETNTGKPATKEVKDDLRQGSTDYWNALSTVGLEAKVFASAVTYWNCYKKSDCGGQLLDRVESGAACRNIGGKSIGKNNRAECTPAKN